jgi:L-Lysine epsilon oxidase N-terminal/L-lysine epsilon oxidase C-terminal domain
VSGPVYKIHPSIGVARVGDSDECYFAPEGSGDLPINPDGHRFVPEDFRDRSGHLRRQAARFQVFRHGSEHPEDPGVPVRPGAGDVSAIEWTVHVANKKASWYEFIVGSGSSGYAPDHPLRNREVDDPAERQQQLIIDPGPRTVRGPNQSRSFSADDNPDHYPVTFPPGSIEPNAITTLGGMRTDETSRLIVLGGFGRSGSNRLPPKVDDYANNDGWWDDMADGPVSARLIMDDGSVAPVEGGAWVLVTPPKFAPQLVNLVSLYDTMLDVAVRQMGLRPEIYRVGLWNRDYLSSWEDEVRPILERIQHYTHVAAIPRNAHELDMAKLGDPDPAYRGTRQFYLGLIRPPDQTNLRSSPWSGMPLMPVLCGDNCFVPGPLGSAYLTVTQLQYFHLQQWADGKFVPGSSSALTGGAALDRAALENCVGGAFSPGIEMTWVSRDPSIYSEPFRIHAAAEVPQPLSLGQDFARGLEPGDLCKYMAVPWQGDFNECSGETAGGRYAYWWPAQRPDYVYVEHGGELRQVAWVGSDTDQNADDYLEFADDTEMVEMWSRLGFIYNKGTPEDPRFVEVERILPRSAT